MQNLHLINSYEKPIGEFLQPNRKIAAITSLHGESSKLLKPDITCEPISVYFSDYRNHYVTFTEDEILVDGESSDSPYFTFPFLINFAAMSESGDYAIVASTDSVYIFDFDTKELTKAIDNFNDQILFATFRSDNKFCAIATNNYVQTLSSEIPDQQGKYEIESPTGISWNPLGSWLAVSSRNKILFLEKNCCLRQIVDLDSDIVALNWSSHRDIVSVLDVNNRVTILSMKNRVFFRKIAFQLKSGKFVPSIFWAKDNLSFSLVCEDNATVYAFDLNHTVDKNDNSIFVINGKELQVSDWSRSLIPPPLYHRKHLFDEQITAIASNNSEIAVFTLNTLNLINEKVMIGLPGIVQCASYIDNVLHFACGNIIYKLVDGNITEVIQYSSFVSFLTPSFVVTAISTIISPSSGQTVTLDDIGEFVQNRNDYVALLRNGHLYMSNRKLAEDVISVLFDEELLSYVHITQKGYFCTIQYGIESTSRQIEPLAQLLFFSKPIYSIITLMNRGNIETSAPHVIVEAAMRNLIANHQYSEALRISKKYQIPFSKFISLGDIDLKILCEQVSDLQLRSCLSVLKPINCGIDLQFVLRFLTHIFGVPVGFELAKRILTVPEYDVERPEVVQFSSACCICFILLDNPVSAVSFSCSFNDSDVVKTVITFLLSLYDNNQLYDISLKTYNTNCIASIALITMKEPSSYVPFIEELEKMTNIPLKKALIDEAASDFESAIRHYAEAGDDYSEKSLYIIQRDKLYDVGINAYPIGSSTWLKIIRLKLESLTSASKKNRDNDAIATTAVLSRNADIILEFITEIVKSKLWKISMPYLQPDHYPAVRKALVSDRQIKEAALFTANYLSAEREEAQRLFLKCNEWYSAIEFGANPAEVALTAYDALLKEAQRKKENAKVLKLKYEDIKVKQGTHPESNVRHGKNKDKRGLPAIVNQLYSILPDENKYTEFQQVEDLLKMNGHEDKCLEMRTAFRQMVREIWPIPALPSNETMPPPPYLREIL